MSLKYNPFLNKKPNENKNWIVACVALVVTVRSIFRCVQFWQMSTPWDCFHFNISHATNWRLFCLFTHCILKIQQELTHFNRNTIRTTYFREYFLLEINVKMSCCIIGCPNEGTSASKDTTYHLFPHPTKGLFQTHCSKLRNTVISNLSDAVRFQSWIEACNNSRLQQMDALTVHKRYRICRRHFDADCLNGGCRRLLNTAVPTLHLSKLEGTGDSNVVKSIYVPDNQANFKSEQHVELIPTEDPTGITKKVKGKE